MVDVLEDLIARVRAAETPDHELDVRIYCLLNGAEFVRRATSQDRFYPHEDREPSPRGGGGFVGAGRFLVRFGEEYAARGPHHHRHQTLLDAPGYTSSLDAALRLVPPGWAWMAGCAPGDGYFADLQTMGGGDPGAVLKAAQAHGPTAALALCLGCLMARFEEVRGEPK